MKINSGAGKRLAAKLTALALCVCLLSGNPRAYALDTDTDPAGEEDPFRLVDIYCSQSAQEALGDGQLQTLVDLIVTSIEPQAVNLLIKSFPCFQDAAANDGIGREIGLYIYYGTGDQDGIAEHEDVAPDAYAYVAGGMDYEEDESGFKYMICVDAESLSTVEEGGAGYARLDLDGETRTRLDTIFCHELFHAFMDDYNRTGMSGYTDFPSFLYSEDEEMTEENWNTLLEETAFPNWFTEGLAGCVGHIYPADLELFRNYHYDPEAQQYLETCTDEQLCRMVSCMGYLEGTGEDLYDLEAATEDNGEGQVTAAIYVTGYMACLYLADLSCRELEGAGAVTFDPSGEISSISSEKLRAGLSEILYRLHCGDTLDAVICEISGGAYMDTADFTKRFIKGHYDGNLQEYTGDPGSLAFCRGYLNYMSRLDAMDPETHPAGSLLMDDFASAKPSPLEKDATATSDFYRFVEKNTMTFSTVSGENRDGGTSYSARDSFETVLEIFKAKHNA